jgi:hypothetical protein
MEETQSREAIAQDRKEWLGWFMVCLRRLNGLLGTQVIEVRLHKLML